MNKALTDDSVEGYSINVTLKQDLKPSFGDFSIGDFLYLDLSKVSYLDIELKSRVREIAVTVDDQGAETLTPKFDIIQ